jgi:hypothetical protein
MAESKLDIVLNPKGFDNIEKAVRGVRTEFAALDKQIVVGGKDIGSLADAFHGMGLQIPTNPMALLGEVTGKAIQFTEQAISETNAYNISMSKLAVTLGIGVEETSRMIQAGDDLGTSQQALTTALEFASKGGLVPTIDNLAKTSDELLAMTDINARNAAATKIFGRSWFEASQTILAGGAAIRAAAAAQSGGLVVTDAVAAATEKNRIAMDEWNDAMMNVKLTVGNHVIPILTENINAILLLTGALDDDTKAQMRNNYARLRDPSLLDSTKAGVKAHTDALQAQGNAYFKNLKVIEDTTIATYDLTGSMDDEHGSAMAVGSAILDNVTGLDHLNQIMADNAIITGKAAQAANAQATAIDNLISVADSGIGGFRDKFKTWQDELKNIKIAPVIQAAEKSGQNIMEALFAGDINQKTANKLLTNLSTAVSQAQTNIANGKPVNIPVVWNFQSGKPVTEANLAHGSANYKLEDLIGGKNPPPVVAQVNLEANPTSDFVAGKAAYDALRDKTITVYINTVPGEGGISSAPPSITPSTPKPSGPNHGLKDSASTGNNYSLTINSSAPTTGAIQEFSIMQSLWG